MMPRSFRRLFRLDAGRSDVPGEIDEELRFHFDVTVAELRAAGLTDEAARAEAARRFGDLGRTRAGLIRIDTGRERGERLAERIGSVFHDLRLAARALVREPLFVATVAVTLALGIGANATMVGLVDRLLFRPPAHVVDHDRVAQLSLTEVDPTYGASTNTGLAWPDYELAARLPVFSGTAAFYTAPVTMGRGLEAERIRASMTSASFWTVLGPRPVAGRFYTEADDRFGAEPVVVLAERFWNRRFGRDPAVIGTALRLGASSFTVIGVAPAGFTGIELNSVDVFYPVRTGFPEMLGPGQEWATTRNWQWVRVIGRLDEGASAEQAATALTTTYRQEVASDSERNRSATFALHPVLPGSGPEAPSSTRITGWLAAVSFAVLLISCANVANLMLARGARRQREIAVRLALGVRRRRLVAHLLLESLLLSVLGGLLALGVIQWGGAAIRTFLLPGIDWNGSPLDGRMALIAAGATILTVLAAGLLPALRTSRADLTDTLKSGGGSAGQGRHHARLRRTLLVTQTALSVVLLMGAGLFVKSLRQVVTLDLGFEPRSLLVLEPDFGERGVDRQRRAAMAERLASELRTLPGISSVSQGIAVSFQTSYSTRLRIPGRDSLPRLRTGYPSYNGVSPEFFATTGMRLTQGRAFTDADRTGGAPVMIVNETMARTWWPGESPLGHCVMIGGGPEPPCAEIVGVVADARQDRLVEEPTMQYFAPIAQSAALGMSGDRTLFLRAAGPADRMIEPIRRATLAAAPELAWVRVVPMARFLEPHIQPWRLGAGVFGAFGVLALLVAAVGLYGVLAYSVATRSREFGVRGALGASARRLVRLVLVEGLRLTGAGVVIGAAAGLAAGRLAESLLFQTSPRDPMVVAVVVLVMVVVSVAASLVPGVRASRTQPAEALRAE